MEGGRECVHDLHFSVYFLVEDMHGVVSLGHKVPVCIINLSFRFYHFGDICAIFEWIVLIDCLVF